MFSSSLTGFRSCSFSPWHPTAIGIARRSRAMKKDFLGTELTILSKKRAKQTLGNQKEE
jgi:hypothetical protein